MGLVLWMFMPACQVGSIGPAAGCTLLGLNLNWFMNGVLIAFLGMFFLVPIGLVINVIGSFLKRKHR